MKTRVAIYGFGRLGRAIYHIASRRKDLEVVMVVSDDSPEYIVGALMTDVVYASLEQQFEAAETGFKHEERHVHVRPVKTADVWQEHNIDIVIDTISVSPTDDTTKQHQKAGAKRVIFTKPSDVLPVIMLGSNEEGLSVVGEAFSAGSPSVIATKLIRDILHNAFGVDHLLEATVEGLLCVEPCTCHEDCDCCSSDSIMAPALVSSVTTVVAQLKKTTKLEEILEALQDAAAEAYYRGIVGVSEEPIVSDAVIGESTSVIVDLTRVSVDGHLVKLTTWYDREWSYANRVVELTADFGKLKGKTV